MLAENLSLKYCIYKHTCIISNKSYIGQTHDLKKRTQAHRKKHSGCVAFARAIQKHGWKNFTTELLAENLSLNEANELEVKYISEHNTLSPSGYNLTSGGLNYVSSEETKRKRSESNKGKHGQPKTLEHKNKISQTLKGRKVPDDVLERRRKKFAVTPRTTKQIESIRAVQQRNIGTKRTEDQKKRMSMAAVGRILTAEHKQKISMALIERPTITVVCPHCAKRGNKMPMMRWHFGKCKRKTT